MFARGNTAFIARQLSFPYNRGAPHAIAMTNHRRPVFSGSTVSVVLLVVAIIAALGIRVGWPFSTVLVDGSVWFREMDGWYHMRLVDNLLANFPHTTQFDPFSFYPHGIEPPFHPLTGWLIALGAMIAGGGTASPATVDFVGALYPAVMGTLTLIPAFFIARRLAGPVGSAATVIVLATMPGEFLSRSLFGFTDHHMTEAFFSTATLLFLLLATEAASEKPVMLSHGMAPPVQVSPRTVVYSVFAGLSLGLYLIGWRGGLMLLAIMLAYAVVRSIVDYARRIDSSDVAFICLVAVAIGGAMVSPLISTHWTPALYVAALLAAGFAPIGLAVLSWLGRSRGWSTKRFIAALCGAALLCLVAVGVASPMVLGYAYRALDFVVPTGASLTITEMHPLFLPSGQFSARIAWTNFVTILPASLVSLVVLWHARRTERDPRMTLFIVWSLFMLAAVLFQRRFGYYYAINAAILTGILCASIWRSEYIQVRVQSLWRRTRTTAAAGSKSARRALRAEQSDRRAAAMVVLLLAGCFVVAFLAPCVSMSRNFATEPGLMTSGWYQTLQWVKQNTPDPLEGDSYYRLYAAPPRGSDFEYPDQAYSVMAWWDYGHWITRASHRIPVANPFQQGVQAAAEYLLSNSEEEGLELLRARDSRYVITDVRTATLAFHGVVAWAGKQRSDYFEVYSQHTSASGLETIVLYYPEYFRSMLVRLQSFSGESYLPDTYRVIRYEDSGGLPGAERLIVELKRFSTYEEAQAYVAGVGSDHVRLVSSDQFQSCVPLEEMTRYHLVFESPEVKTPSGDHVPEVRVFQVTGP